MATNLASFSSLCLSLRRPPLLGKRTYQCYSMQSSKLQHGRTTHGEFNIIRRRDAIAFLFGFSSCLALDSSQAQGAGLPPEEKPRLCDDSCEQQLENVPMVTTESGLQYKDIKVGQGPSPPVGFQVAANYVAMVPSGQIFDRLAHGQTTLVTKENEQKNGEIHIEYIIPFDDEKLRIVEEKSEVNKCNLEDGEKCHLLEIQKILVLETKVKTKTLVLSIIICFSLL